MAYDAIVVGARVAGAPTAMLLARQGLRVLLLDKAKFPSNTLSTHFLWQKDIYYLKKWQLFDRLAASDCPFIPNLVSHYGDFALSGCPVPYQGVREMSAPHRKFLDQMLIDAAVEAGVEFREGFSVRDLIYKDNRVVGINGASAGKTISEKAGIVIGADGRHSVIADKVGSQKYREEPAETIAFYSYFSNAPVRDFISHTENQRTRYVYPTNYGLTVAIAIFRVEELERVRAQPHESFMAALTEIPYIADHLSNAKQEDVLYTVYDLPNFFRQSYGPGWALVGDAAYIKDPIFGQGITDAFFGADLLSQKILAKTNLQEYQDERDAEVNEVFEFTIKACSLDPSDKIKELREAMRSNQDAIDRFCGLFAGHVSPKEFFSEQNIERIMAARGN